MKIDLILLIYTNLKILPFYKLSHILSLEVNIQRVSLFIVHMLENLKIIFRSIFLVVLAKKKCCVFYLLQKIYILGKKTKTNQKL